MTEVKKEPYIYYNMDGDKHEAFGPNHSLADIARWICRNKSEAEELVYLIKEEMEKDTTNANPC